MELNTCIRYTLIYIVLLSVARRVQLIPEYALRLLDWSPPESLSSNNNVDLTTISHDLVSAISHALSCACLNRISKNSETLYYWNPFNFAAALHGPWGMVGNVILLAFVAGCMNGTRQLLLVFIAITMVSLALLGGMGYVVWMVLPVLVSLAWMYHTTQAVLAVCLGAAIFVIPVTTLFGVMPMEPFHRQFATIQPTIDMHWYLMSEVFPSFREYFSRIIFIMGMFLSIGLCLKFHSKTLFLFAAHGMLCTLFNPYPCSSMCAFWMTLLLCEDKTKGIMTLLLWIFSVVTVMNVCAYQIWIQYNQGNANFFYGMNLLQGSVTGLTLIQTLKMVHY